VCSESGEALMTPNSSMILLSARGEIAARRPAAGLRDV